MARQKVKLLLVGGPLFLIVLLHGYAHGPVSGAPGIDFGIMLIMLAPYAVFATVGWLLYSAYQRHAAGTADTGPPLVSGGSGEIERSTDAFASTNGMISPNGMKSSRTGRVR